MTTDQLRFSINVLDAMIADERNDMRQEALARAIAVLRATLAAHDNHWSPRGPSRAAAS